MDGNPLTRRVLRLMAALLATAFLAGCQVSEFTDAKHLVPIPPELIRKMERLDMDERSPILVRLFKEDSSLEVWKEKRDGTYALLKTYEICAWSGELGPKIKEGDRQAPEGFYTVQPHQMNPNSSYHLAFNLGYPNAFDRALGRTGTHLMVHGACSSRGCYSMEDDQISEIYALGREAFRGGQRAFQVQAFPFRMTPENMAKHEGHEHMAFWEMLKEGYDHFEVTRRAPKIDVCDRRYVFNAVPESGSFNATAACPAYSVPDEIMIAVASKQREDQAKRERIVAARERGEQTKAMLAAIFGGGSKDGDDAEAAAGAARQSVAARDAGGLTAPVVRPTAPAARVVRPTAPAAPVVQPATPAEAEASAPATGTGGVPVPRASPRPKETTPTEVVEKRFRFPNIFAGRAHAATEEPVPASTAFAAEPSASDEALKTITPSPSSDLPGVSAGGADADPVPLTAPLPPESPRVVEADEGAGAEANESERRGFFGRAAAGTKGLFRRAGNLFN